MPLPREGVELDYSRWMQNLIGILQIDVTFFKGELIKKLYFEFQTQLSLFSYRMGSDGASSSRHNRSSVGLSK